MLWVDCALTVAQIGLIFPTPPALPAFPVSPLAQPGRTCKFPLPIDVLHKQRRLRLVGSLRCAPWWLRCAPWWPAAAPAPASKDKKGKDSEMMRWGSPPSLMCFSSISPEKPSTARNVSQIVINMSAATIGHQIGYIQLWGNKYYLLKTARQVNSSRRKKSITPGQR